MKLQNQIEEELLELIRQKRATLVSSDRDDLIWSLIINKYFHGSTENQRDFMISIENLLQIYSKIISTEGNAVLYNLIYICLELKFPIGHVLTDMLVYRRLVDRYHEENKDLLLLALKVLIGVSSTYRTETVLIDLIKRESLYRSKFSYCLHFLEFFGRKENPAGIKESLNNLLDFDITDSEVKLIASQLKTTFMTVAPEIFLEWYNDKIDITTKNDEILVGRAVGSTTQSQTHNKKTESLIENPMNKVLLRLVEISKNKNSFRSDEWSKAFNLIEAYSSNFLPKANKHSLADESSDLSIIELFGNAYKGNALAISSTGGSE